MTRASESERAYEKALTFLERRSRTEAEVRERLGRAEFGEDATEAAIKKLTEAGFLDDEDYAERYLELLLAKGRGRRRIADEMRRKGLADEIVRRHIEEGVSRESETEAAEDAARKLLEQLGETDCDRTARMKILQKINRKLVSLGYPYEVVGDVMSKIRGEF